MPTMSVATVTRQEILQQAIRQLEAAGVPDARRNAEWLLCEVLSCSRAQLYAYPDEPVGAAQQAQLAALLARRLRREPLQYVLGYVEFLGLRLEVGPGVLIPRPETEWLTARLLEILPTRKPLRLLDVGTGSGCIALAIKHHQPAMQVYACDISTDALAIAQRNAERLGLDVVWLQADVLAADFPAQVPGPFDVIVSNPPYLALDEAETLPPEVRDYEPPVALYAGADPLRFYRALAHHGQQLLVPGGQLVCEVHAYHAGEVIHVLATKGYSNVTLEHDLAGLPRMVRAVLPKPDARCVQIDLC
ncbi:peptide chain release factor N(5)-glutamine methyltransferase [Rhodothermus bifroesti]|uniref:Release factor glutamine methyltransferase n=2 Tax=Rhodothermus TaxID=29548 RepID=A0A7V2AYC8_RHOMR|nr:peptide chain release factor N(5)-glutamine methyltransferase [Rhodothermus bifroesti]